MSHVFMNTHLEHQQLETAEHPVEMKCNELDQTDIIREFIKVIKHSEHVNCEDTYRLSHCIYFHFKLQDCMLTTSLCIALILIPKVRRTAVFAVHFNR